MDLQQNQILKQFFKTRTYLIELAYRKFQKIIIMLNNQNLKYKINMIRQFKGLASLRLGNLKTYFQIFRCILNKVNYLILP